MRTFRPLTVEALVAARADEPGALLLAGGTDVMVDVNYGRLRPACVIDVSRVAELRGWSVRDGRLRIGAGVTFARVERELAAHAPALATAARTVGSPQIRQRATIGGNIGTASPAGDALPVLVAGGATIELASARGVRAVPARGYFLAPRRTVRAADECVLAVTLPAGAGSAQQFSKVGVRNAMVIAVASFALHVDAARATVGTGMGSVGPVPLAAEAAERWLASVLFDASGALRRPGEDVLRRFATLVADAASPIDDLRGTASYRRHVLRTMARRTLGWAVADLMRSA
jgi:CO/xanthine dehydrogenase FAD-binding subunit